MPRKKDVANQIDAFIKATNSERFEMLTYGVEFEYQSNKDSDDWCGCLDYLDYDQTHDLDTMYDHQNERANEIMDCFSDLVDHIRLDDVNTLVFYAVTGRKPTEFNRFLWSNRGYHPLKSRYNNKMRTMLTELWEESPIGDEEEFLEQYLCINWDDLRESVEESVREDWDDSEYRYDIHILKRDHCECCNEVEAPDRCEHDEDSSVSGGEIRTIGANDYDELMESAKKIISNIECTTGAYTDKNCSAHLHIQLGDIRHYYGDGNLHRCIMEYIAMNTHLLPQSVLERLHQPNCNIRADICNAKSTWLYFHSQGTIEFRLFGNITDIDDFERCVQFAVNALAYAYRVRKLRRKRLKPKQFAELSKVFESFKERNFGPPMRHIAMLTVSDLEQQIRNIAA